MKYKCEDEEQTFERTWIWSKGNKYEGERVVAHIIQFPDGMVDENSYHINANGIVDGTCFDKDYAEKVAKALGLVEVYYEEEYKPY